VDRHPFLTWRFLRHAEKNSRLPGLKIAISRFESAYESHFGRGAGSAKAGFEVLSIRTVAWLSSGPSLVSGMEPMERAESFGRV